MKKLCIYLLFMIVISCKKNSDSACEKWLVRDYCVASQNVSCDRSGTYHEMSICGDDLKLAKDHKVKLRLDEGDVKLYTQFVKKVE